MTLPPLEQTALLLDMDGTLIDIAPTPDAVVVPPGLVASLRRLGERLDGALAVVSGRPVEDVDRVLDHAPHAVAGEHGVAIRHDPGAPLQRANLPTPPEAWLLEAEALAAAWPGLDGNGVGCREKIRVLNENHAEVAQVLRDAFDDAVLMGVDEAEMRQILNNLITGLPSPKRGA